MRIHHLILPSVRPLTEAVRYDVRKLAHYPGGDTHPTRGFPDLLDLSLLTPQVRDPTEVTRYP